MRDDKVLRRFPDHTGGRCRILPFGETIAGMSDMLAWKCGDKATDTPCGGGVASCFGMLDAVRPGSANRG